MTFAFLDIGNDFIQNILDHCIEQARHRIAGRCLVRFLDLGFCPHWQLRHLLLGLYNTIVLPLQPIHLGFIKFEQTIAIVFELVLEKNVFDGNHRVCRLGDEPDHTVPTDADAELLHYTIEMVDQRRVLQFIAQGQ